MGRWDYSVANQPCGTLAVERLKGLFEEGLQILEMRPFPVQFLAGQADVKFVEVQPGARRQAIRNRFFVHGSQQPVTMQAAQKWPGRLVQAVVAHDLD